MQETPLNVLLVEDNPGDARLLKESLLEEAGDIFRITWVKDLESAKHRISRELIDAIVLDLNLPDSDGFHTFDAVHAAAPEIPILVLTGLEDDEVGLRAIQQGAQDYLAKSDLSGSAVARALRYAVERNRRRIREFRNKTEAVRQGKVVVFLGAKGGVGATTLVLNVVSLLAKNVQEPVSAAELRPDFGSFASHLHESPVHNLGTLMRLDLTAAADSVLDKCILRSRLGFDVLFSPQRPQEFAELKPKAVAQLLGRLARRYAYTLVDLPNHFGPVMETAISHGDLTVLVTERDPSSLAAAAATLRFFQSRKNKLPPTGLVVVNRSLMIDGTAPRKIEAALGCELFGVVPPAPEVSMSAQKYGLPLALHRPLSAPASMLNSISEKIRRRLVTPTAGKRAIEKVPA